MPDYQADTHAPDVPTETYQAHIEGQDWLGIKNAEDRTKEAWIRMPAVYVVDTEAWA